MTLTEMARRLRPLIEKAAQSLDEADALEAVQLYPRWSADGAYAAGDRVQHDGKLYRILQQHTAQADWSPDKAPSLFAEVLPGQEDTPIGEWKQPDSTNPYMIGDRVTYNGKVYESIIDNNVWSPADYPAGWQEVTDNDSGE